MQQGATKELIDNLIAKRTILKSALGTNLRYTNRQKYNWLHSVYFDHEVTKFLTQAILKHEITKDPKWLKKFVLRLHLLCKNSEFSI
jgi:hypothetical protein